MRREKMLVNSNILKYLRGEKEIDQTRNRTRTLFDKTKTLC